MSFDFNAAFLMSVVDQVAASPVETIVLEIQGDVEVRWLDVTLDKDENQIQESQPTRETFVEVTTDAGFELHEYQWTVQDCEVFAENLLLNGLADLKKVTHSADFFSAAHWFFGEQEPGLTPELCANASGLNLDRLLDGIKATLPVKSHRYIERMENYYYKKMMADNKAMH